MKELSIEEKAKLYDEALKVANKYEDTHIMFSSIKDEMFPELKESEDEKIRQELIEIIHLAYDCGCSLNKEQCDKYLAWLEKQGENNDLPPVTGRETLDEYAYQVAYDLSNDWLKDTPTWDDVETAVKLGAKWLEKQRSKDNVEDVDILHRFSFYSYKDEPNVLYLAGLYVNEGCRNKGIGTKILEVADEVSKRLNCHTIRLKTKKDSNAERLYRTHGYNSLATEDKDEIWLEKQSEQETLCDKCRKEQPSHSCQDITVLGRCAVEHEHKPTDKVEPKFKVGDWIITSKKHIWYVDETPETTSDLYRLINQYGKVEVAEFEAVDKKAKLWTIQDAKDGDVLAYKNDIVIFKENNYEPKDKSGCMFVHCSCDNFYEIGGINPTYYKPATKEQRDLLFQKMKEAGYKWDVDEKKLKKIEQEPAEWSVEDYNKMNYLIALIQDSTMHNPALRTTNEEIEDWLKNLKDKVQPQPKQEWSEEDDSKLKEVLYYVEYVNKTNVTFQQRDLTYLINWLKSLRPQSHWKPSDEQMRVLDLAIRCGINRGTTEETTLVSLFNDLKKLK